MTSSITDAGAHSTELRHVERVMGTVVSIVAHVDDPDRRTSVRAALARAVAWLHEVEDRFTTFRDGSEWMRYACGELSLFDAHPDVAYVVERTAELETLTCGAFSLRANPGKPLDPAAYVKGWATQRAADLLVQAGATSVCVNGGGDVVVWGGSRPWRVGIRDPFHGDGVSAVVELGQGGVATSGAYERGTHVFDPSTQQGLATRVASVTVVGPDLGLADAYATALLVDLSRAGNAHAREQTLPAWFELLDDYEAIVITA